MPAARRLLYIIHDVIIRNYGNRCAASLDRHPGKILSCRRETVRVDYDHFTDMLIACFHFTLNFLAL